MTDNAVLNNSLVTSAENPHLGGNIREGDSDCYAPNVWKHVVSRFCIESMMDLGSGLGHAAHFFSRLGVKTLAVEGLAENVRASRYPALLHDLTRGPVQTVVDLVHCQEVVEHIDEKHLDHVLQSLSCGRVILMTHGLPGQPGYHHVNLQMPDYWIGHLQACGFDYLAEDTRKVRKIAEQDGAIYLQRTALLFHRR